LPEGTVQRRGLIVLGSTGTIGRLTLDVARRFPDRLRILGLAAGTDATRLAEQVRAHRPEAVALADPAAAADLRARLKGAWDGEILTGPEGVERLAVRPEAAVVVNGIVGAAGLRPTLAALEAGKRVGLANKESLVAAGHLVRRAREHGGGEILPIDSEHCALFQCLQGRAPEEVARVTLTASGGPFRALPSEALERVGVRETLAHPTWSMGKRITVDSATLFNKGMELIEAHWLFDLPLDRVRALIHPQSIVHGLVELCDGSLLAQLSQPDMRLPIQLALSHPERWGPVGPVCDLAALGALSFEEPDAARFPCLGIARRAGEIGGTAPAALNGADEVLVDAFLGGTIPLPAIGRALELILRRHQTQPDPTLEQVIDADAWGRREARAVLDAADATRR
jgi:1-deoxy-D-xylulose-5-phosphate reductoisomerase